MSKLDELSVGAEVVIAIKYLGFGYGGQHAIVSKIMGGLDLPDDNPYKTGMVEVNIPGYRDGVCFPPSDLVLCQEGVWPEPKLGGLRDIPEPIEATAKAETHDVNQPSKTSDELSDRLDDLRKRYQNDGADFPLGFEYDVLALIEFEVQLAYGRGADDQREECVARDASKLRQARIEGGLKALHKLQMRIPVKFAIPIKDSPMELARDGQVFNSVIDKVNREIRNVRQGLEVRLKGGQDHE